MTQFLGEGASLSLPGLSKGPFDVEYEGRTKELNEAVNIRQSVIAYLSHAGTGGRNYGRN